MIVISPATPDLVALEDWLDVELQSDYSVSVVGVTHAQVKGICGVM